ncbi:tRNA methyltransferase 44 [Bulinus truncatus]|nr:tRNA methyltransferase 44 [Bulinus truncatus]
MTLVTQWLATCMLLLRPQRHQSASMVTAASLVWEEVKITQQKVEVPKEPNNFKDLTGETEQYTIIFRELIPKSEFFPKLLEAVIYDKHRVAVSFLPLSQDCGEEISPTSELSYSFQFKSVNKDLPSWAVGNEIVLSWSCDHSESEDARRQLTSTWLQSVLLDKLVLWSHINDISTSVTSLKLVSIDTYKDTYIRLKNTYGRDLVKNWTERTDPKKFVYEDVAIAAYLLLIWEEERERKNLQHKQSFVDLGCGNGLLVYILSKEGYKGLGIDLRKRNIWDSFGPEIDLRVKTISPSADHLYPDYQWIIGNHSDELTPWIPVIAARSSYDCCFLLLPCCHHDFVGKFGVSEKGKSRYESYLDYVQEIISYCGFIPESDSLRIPSTKRICFIGRKRTYKKEDETEKDVERQAFIDKRTAHIHSLMAHRQKYPYGSIKKLDSSSLFTESVATGGENEPGIQFEKHTDISLKISPENQCKPTEICSSTVTCSVDKRKFVDSETSNNADDVSSSVCLDKCLKKCRTENATRRQTADDDIEVDCAKAFETCVHMKGSQCAAGTGTTEPCDLHSVTEKTKQWASEFRPRAVEQKVRNCQAVSEDIKTHIVNIVFKLVLSAPDAVQIELETGRKWMKGGSVSLNNIVDHLDKSTLLALKSECGGLQTLLRNHSYIFQVTGGRVQLRDFTQPNPWLGSNPNKLKNKQKKQGRDTRKTTLCWFHIHHLQGCPRSSEDCQFAHSESELKVRSDS